MLGSRVSSLEKDKDLPSEDGSAEAQVFDKPPAKQGSLLGIASRIRVGSPGEDDGPEWNNIYNASEDRDGSPWLAKCIASRAP